MGISQANGSGKGAHHVYVDNTSPQRYRGLKTVSSAFLKEWYKLRGTYPSLTRGVDLHVNPSGQYEGVTHQGYPLKDPDPTHARYQRRIDMAADQAMHLPHGTNIYALAHELGHANERNYIDGPDAGDIYAGLAGFAPQELAAQRNQFGTPITTGAYARNAGVAPNEQYAADFAGSLGRRWPDGQQTSGDALRALQYLRLLPKGAGYGQGSNHGRGDNTALNGWQARMLAANQQAIYAGIPKRQSLPTGNSSVADFIQLVGRLRNDATPVRSFAHGGGRAS